MSDRDPRPVRVADKDRDEPFLQRWARLKRDSHEAPPDESGTPARPPAGKLPDEAERDEHAAASSEAHQSEVEPAELPTLDSLTAESDFGPFMKEGVDPALRRLALRKLWSNPKYAVVDPLDPYKADYQAFTALGDTITSDMKFHAERLIREQMEKAAEAAEAAGTASPSENVAAEQEAQAAGVSPAGVQDDEPADRAAGQDPTEDADERRDA